MTQPRVVVAPVDGPSPTPPRGLDPDASAALDALEPWFASTDPIALLDRAGVHALVRDLAFAAASLVGSDRRRTVVSTETQQVAWEIGLERRDGNLLVSVYRGGAQPDVPQTGRPVPLQRAGETLLAAMARLDGRLTSRQRPGGDAAGQPGGTRGMALARAELRRALAEPAACSDPGLVPVAVASSGRSRLRLAGRFEVPQGLAGADGAAELVRADLHALLWLGELVVTVAESGCELRDVHVFLLAEQLAALSTLALDACDARRSMLRRVRAGNTTVGLRVDPSGEVHLLLPGRDGTTRRLPAVPAEELVRAVSSFGRELARAVAAVDRSQAANLRLRALESSARRLGRRLRPTSVPRTVLNQAPESYRAFAESDDGRPTGERRAGIGKLRFTESWHAVVGAIDLRSVLLVGERLLVGSQHELACLERSMGFVLWRQPVERAISIMTPRGLARLGPDGSLSVHSLEDGEVQTRLELEPCVGAATSGTVVAAPSLPPLLLVGEGARHLTAVDLDAGEVRWRRALRRRGLPRLRRAGKLVVATAGEGEIQAFDLLSGETVWRRCGPLCYRTAPAIHHDALYALAEPARGASEPARLERIDVWSGEVLWSTAVPRPVRPIGPPRLGGDTVLLITDDDERQGLLAFARETGELRFDLPGGLVAGRAACLVIDDLVVASGESGQLVAVDAADGRLRYRHVFASGRGVDVVDRPMSYQPVLRCGALFVPQSEIYVVRPADGEVLGNIACDLVPDLLRVDERCGVYVGEASGHLTAYAAQPTLRLVTAVTP